MRVTSSYKVEIRKLHKPLKRTLAVCREAVSFLMPVIDGEWEHLSEIEGMKRRFNEAEHLIHGTKGNTAVYPFDKAFPKMPSYLRRAILQHVIGAVSSLRSKGQGKQEGEDAGSDCLQGEAEGGAAVKRQTGTPERVPHYMPVFYRDNMYRKEEDRTYLKLYSGRDWLWYPVDLRKTDLSYLRRHWSGVQAKSPVLVKRHKKYYLQFAFEEQVSFSKTGPEKRRICAVDLGLNTDAVCSIMEADGTVAGRRFIRFPAEKDRLHHVLNRIRKKQRQYGSGSVSSFWAYAKRLNEEIGRRTASAIVAYAHEQGAECIVFEYLMMRGKIRGKNRMKLHMWKKNTIQKTAEHQAHRHGIRISRVCAVKTSALAYDGSGAVSRDPGNHSLAAFSNGKQYNCDLSASYNIGARYYIREILKSVPETERSVLTAKVPGVQRRTSCVYADLLALAEAGRGIA